MPNKDMEFFKGKDEDSFLTAWQAQYGVLSEEGIDELYLNITEEIDRQVESGEHGLGDIFEYKGIQVGKSDYNQFHQIYLFEQEN
ncbi:hypothetical protein ACEN32_00750 [Marinilactibacillus psychrotolerans]|uniref:hypothetical protein n=1 Tax=Marinilactibacillus psychrotolerans TaxID=191770 RepID=UPI003888419E